MYNKIAPIILNSGKATGFSDVFVAQPDSLKESLAGKIFIIAEISGKKTDGRKIMSFLISSLEDTYYNDEKILLRDKIEGLKIENIFEAAISKTNKYLSEFLIDEKIRLNTSATNLTVGVIYENKLYFSSFGKNRSLLIYRHGEQYEIINVEASASDVVVEDNSDSDKAVFKTPSLFSSVISGEIPTGSYFVFSSEAIPEYISSREMIDIITKLPPIVAAEQLKNILTKINSFVPFLGVIIKNTTGIDNQEMRDDVEENLTAHSSISSMNYTEQKTERMLAPAGLISLSKMYRGLQRAIKNLQPAPSLNSKKSYRFDEDKKMVNSTIDLSTNKDLSITRLDSFLIKEKIFFKKKPNLIGAGLKNIVLNLPSVFSPRLWAGLFMGAKRWLGGLNKKNRYLFLALAAVVVIFVASIILTNYSKKQQAAKNNYNNLVATIDERQTQIDNYLSYGNEAGAKSLLADANTLLGYLPKEKKDQIATYNRLQDKLNIQTDKIQKVVKIDSPEKVNDLSGLNINNIVYVDAKIFASGGNMLYAVVPKTSASTKLTVTGATNLSDPQFDKANNIYYQDGANIVGFNLKTSQSTVKPISSAFNADGLTSFNIYGGNLYVIAKNKNQIYRISADKSGYSVKTDWIKEAADLSNASDFAIDGNIYILKTSGEVNKYFKGKKVDATSFLGLAISPAMTSASKVFIGTKYIYIFEASSKRLAVIALKDGALVNQYQVNSLSQPKDFTVDEANKTAYFLDNDMIYKITLNQ